MKPKGVDAYPLAWPSGWKRTKYRARSRFKVNRGAATSAVFEELRRLGASSIVLSTNVELRLDGIPYANRRSPTDPGVAVYFQYKQKPMVFACDQWVSVEENTWAIAKTIEAIRGIERWGASDMLERAFSGFAALPQPATESWWEILGVGQYDSPEKIKAARDRLALEAHPDRGGSSAQMARINDAYRRAGL